MPNVMISTTDPAIFKPAEAVPFAEEITTERQDLVQDELKKAERQIAPVEAKERPKSAGNNAQQGYEAQANGLEAHPILAKAAQFSGIDPNVHVLPPNSPEGIEAYRQLQNQLALTKRLAKQHEQNTRLGR